MADQSAFDPDKFLGSSGFDPDKFLGAGGQPQSPQGAPQQAAQEAPPIPELVAGTPEQMMQQRARNLQSQLGLQEPVSPTESVPYSARVGAALMPTAPEKQAYYESRYGKGSFLPISSERALVRVPDNKGSYQWVIDNPKGFDFGDVAELAAKIPETTAAIAAGAQALPGPAGMVAKLAQASGVTALAGHAAGALQDALVRKSFNLPIQPEEIAKRRGMNTIVDFFLGMGGGAVAEKIAGKAQAGAAVKASVRAFLEEGEDAKKALKGAGVNPATAAEVADAVRAQSPSALTSAEAGDVIANSLTAGDVSLRQQAEGAAKKAATSLEARAMSEIGAATTPVSLSPVDVGNAAIGGAKTTFDTAKKATEAMLNNALSTISSAAGTAGVGTNFINLNNTSQLIANQRKLALQTATGPNTLYTPYLDLLNQLGKSTGVGQDLMSVRNLRSMIGAKIGGDDSMFPGMDKAFAKKLYQSLSEDIDNSIKAFSGAGAKELQAYNAAYKAMLEPIEASEFVGKLVNGGFKNPEDAVAYMTKAGTADWAAAKQVLPAPTFDTMRRGVLDQLMGSAKVNIMGTDVADLGALARNVSQLDPTVRDVVFNGSNKWKWLDQAGKEFDFIAKKQGLFASRALPSLNDVEAAMTLADTQGFTAANKYLKDALQFTEERRNNLAQSLVSQVSNGNRTLVAQNPEAFFDSFVMSGNFRPAYVKSVMDKLSPSERTDVANAAFQHLFDRAASAANATATKTPRGYSFEQMLQNVYGSKQQQQSIEHVIGPDRLDLIKNWAKYELALAATTREEVKSGRQITGLLARLPYRNLAAAGFVSYALEKASGRAFLAQANPNAAKLFAQARFLENNPTLGAASIALIQKARGTTGYGNYLDMMHGFTPEQQDAIDGYLVGR